MKPVKTTLRRIGLLLALGAGLGAAAQTTLQNAQGTIRAQLDSAGRLASLDLSAAGERAVGFRTDAFAGPALTAGGQPLALQPQGGARFAGANDSLQYALAYSADARGLRLTVTCRALRDLSGLQFSLRLGLDTEMDHFPQWRHAFFPTLLRCERTHFWGYFMSPLGRIVAVSSPDPVASYHLHYNNDRQLHSFGHGHRIRTASLDLVNPAPLPARHPRLNGLKAGETRAWRIYLDEVTSLAELPALVAGRTRAAVVQAGLYTLAPGETTRLCLAAPSRPRLALRGPDGKSRRLKATPDGAGRWTASFSPEATGTYTLTAECGGKRSEAILACRHARYSDYLKAARTACLRYPQKATSNVESWYGFFSAYKARELFPDAQADAAVDSLFRAVYARMYDPVTNCPLPAAMPNRIQNHALMAALLAQRYRATGCTDDLRRAADLADYILTRQTPDGAYRNGKTHYTAVIYVAKALMEVMAEERKLAAEGNEWAYRFRKHYHSVTKAVDELARSLDNIQTEGEMTFEDGMISCSYTQIAGFALWQPEGSEARRRYTEAARKLADMHRCLSQLVVPDARMNGGSLRYWEAQYDILSFPDMMNSPHGWSAWRIYGLRSLYLLTGDYRYLRQMTNAIGSCIQLIDPATGRLNWAFVCDPYIRAAVFEPDPARPGKGKYTERVIGEQYMPMISDWYRAQSDKCLTGYWGYDGGCCDNDVHEIFKCLGEVMLTSAYVHELPDGSLAAVNCRAERQGDAVRVVPQEDCVATVYVHMEAETPVTVDFADGPHSARLRQGAVSRTSAARL